MTIKIISLLILSFMAFAFLSGVAIVQLRKKYGDDLRVTFYLFSLTMVITLALATYAFITGAISNGTFQGPIGSFLSRLLTVMLDLEKDLMILLVIVGIILIPQVLNYIICGFIGCASPVIFIEGSLTFLIWGVIKAFSVSAAIFASLFILYACSVLKTNGHEMLGTLYMTSMSLSFSLTTLMLYRDSQGAVDALQTKCPKLMNKLASLHALAARHEQSSASNKKINLAEQSKPFTEHLSSKGPSDDTHAQTSSSPQKAQS